MAMNRFGLLSIAGLAVVLSLGLATRASAQQAAPAPSPMASTDPDNQWHFRITPYVWLPTINAQFHFLRPSVPPGAPAERFADVQVGPNSYLSHVNSAAEIAAEADKADSSVFADVIYLNVGDAAASVINIGGPLGNIHIPLNLSTSVRLTTTIATGGFGKQFWHVADSEGTAFVGLRYINQTVSAAWTLTGPLGMFSPTGTATGAKSDLEPLAGLRGRFGLGGHWFVPVYGDYGGSGSITTYQWFGGIAHEYRGGAQMLIWREMAFFANNDASGLIQNLHLGGPAFAWSFYL
jgi:hypothetical protein